MVVHRLHRAPSSSKLSPFRSTLPNASINHAQPGRTRTFLHSDLLRDRPVAFNAVPSVVRHLLLLLARGSKPVVRRLIPLRQSRARVVFVVEAVGRFRPAREGSFCLLEGRT